MKNKKRIVSFFLMVILAVSMISGTNIVFAEEATGSKTATIAITGLPNEVHNGDEITVSVTISGENNAVIGGATGYIRTTGLKYVSSSGTGFYATSEEVFTFASSSSSAPKSQTWNYKYEVVAADGAEVSVEVYDVTANETVDNDYKEFIIKLDSKKTAKVVAKKEPTPTPSTDVEPTPPAESTPTTNPTPTATPSTSPEATPTIEPTPTIAPTASPTAAPTETPTNTPAPTESPWSGWIPPTGSYTPPTSGNNIPGPGESSAGVNKTGLNSAIGVAKNTLAGGTNYSAEAASALSSAIAKAEAISSDPNATQAQVDAGTALVDAVSAAAARTADGKAYTDETIAALNASLAEAKAVCDDPAATIEQINNVIGKLNAAVAGLTEAPAVTEPPKDDVPKTADESVAVWPFALLMLAAGAAAVVLFRKRSLNGR